MNIKTLALAAAATGLIASAAAADSFAFKDSFSGQTVELGQVTANGNGVVSLYDFHTGEQGALLGATDINAGANYDVRVTLDRPAVNDVLAVLTVDGEVVATQEFDNVR